MKQEHSKDQQLFFQEALIFEKLYKDTSNNDYFPKFYSSFHYNQYFCNILEFIPGGDLSNLLDIFQRFDESLARFYAAEIVEALHTLHNAGFLHRDLKPENILLDKDGHIKLIDFGLSEPLQIKNKEAQGKRILGTPYYIAPEVIEGSSMIDCGCDWWSFGVLCFEMLVGSLPFSGKNIKEIFHKICQGEIPWKNIKIGEGDDMISVKSFDLLNKLLKRREERIDYEEIKAHVFFEGIITFLKDYIFCWKRN